MSQDQSEDATPQPSDANEFHMSVLQLVYKYLEHAGGNEVRLAAFAKAQVVCGEAVRSVIARSALLGRTPTMRDWSQADLLDLIERADKADKAPGEE